MSFEIRNQKYEIQNTNESEDVSLHVKRDTVAHVTPSRET